MIKNHICDAILNFGPRDLLITQTLQYSNFISRPINILQVGAIEDLSLKFRHGSGWSDIFFASYISMFGGKLTVVDIDQSHLDNSEKVLSEFNAEYSLVLSDALDVIKENNSSYDIIYLDGSNHPEETRDQYNSIDKDSTAIIMVDDFSIKGTLIKFDKRYSGQVYNATEQGVYVGVNANAFFVNKLWNKKIL